MTSEDGQRLRATEAADGFLQPFRTIVQRGVPVRIVYGSDDIFWTEFQRAAEGRLGRVLEKAGDTVEVDTVPGIIRGFTSVRIQDLSVQNIVDWVKARG